MDQTQLHKQTHGQTDGQCDFYIPPKFHILNITICRPRFILQIGKICQKLDSFFNANKIVFVIINMIFLLEIALFYKTALLHR